MGIADSFSVFDDIIRNNVLWRKGLLLRRALANRDIFNRSDARIHAIILEIPGHRFAHHDLIALITDKSGKRNLTILVPLDTGDFIQRVAVDRTGRVFFKPCVRNKQLLIAGKLVYRYLTVQIPAGKRQRIDLVPGFRL